MGSENSKSDNEQESQRNQPNRQRLYTEDEIQSALAIQKIMFEAKQWLQPTRRRPYTEDEIQSDLANQKTMFEAKQLKMPTSSRIYPNLQTQNQNTISRPTTSTAVHYQSAKLTSAGASYVKPTFDRPPYVTPSSAGPSLATSSSARPSHATSSSAGPSLATSSSAGPSHATSSFAGPSHVRTSFAGPLHFRPSFARPSHVRTTFARPSFAGPNKRNHKRNQAQQTRSRTSSRIYPNLQTQNQNTISRPTTSTAVHYQVFPSAPPENVLYSPSNITASRQIYQQTSPAQPPTPLPRSAKLTSAGASYVKPTFDRPPYVTPSSAGPSLATSSSARPSHATSSSAGPSLATSSSAGPSHATSSFAGPSHVRTSFAGPLHFRPSFAGPNKRNHKQNQAQQTRSRTRVNQKMQQLNGIVNCVTCNGQLSLHIYQCTNGHSSCEGCRFKMARCGNCTERITDMRNITLESTLADLTINTEEQIKCSNAKDGCRFHFKKEELQNHLEECPFNIISCPVMEFFGDCSWKGMKKQLRTHFNDAHPKHKEADVNKEMHIIVIDIDFKVMHLVNIGFHQFLVHIRLDTSLNNIYMVTQYLGTNFSASKWSYEWHVYNKKEPRRKFEYIDICKSNATPVSEIINNNNCAVINMNYAKTFLDSGRLTFKFYIKKQFDNKQRKQRMDF